MVLAWLLPLLIAAAVGTGAVGISAANKSSNSGSSKNGFWQSIWQGIKDIFAIKKGKYGEIDSSGTSYSQELAEDAEIQQALNSNSGFLLDPYGGTKIDGPSNINGSGFGVPAGSSAQTSAASNTDAGTIAAHIENSENGSGGQGVDNTVDWIKQIMMALGLNNLFGSSGDSDWRSYQDIVDDERKYGYGMISDARRWEEYMASTAYQRTVKDIEAAGLNPWLAVQSGSLSPANWGSVDSGSALGSISTSLSQSLSNSNSNSSSAIIVALIMMIAKMAMS